MASLEDWALVLGYLYYVMVIESQVRRNGEYYVFSFQCPMCKIARVYLICLGSDFYWVEADGVLTPLKKDNTPSNAHCDFCGADLKFYHQKENGKHKVIFEGYSH